MRGGASVDNPASFRTGPDSAPVKVVEFSDYQCPACKSIEPHVKTLVASYGDRVQLVYRNFPLPQHKNAMAAALAAEAEALGLRPIVVPTLMRDAAARGWMRPTSWRVPKPAMRPAKRHCVSTRSAWRAALPASSTSSIRM